MLSRNTGVGRAYEVDPYAHVPLGPGEETVNYWTDPTLILAPPVKRLPNRGIMPKTMVLGVRMDGQAFAFAPPSLPSSRTVKIETVIAVKALTVTYDPHYSTYADTVAEPEHGIMFPITCFWFAWQASYPDTSLVRIPLTQQEAD